MEYQTKNQGKMNFATLILILLIIYVLFKVDIRGAVQGPKFQKNAIYMKEIVLSIKDKYFVEQEISIAFGKIFGENFSIQNSFFDPQNINLISNINPENFSETFNIPMSKNNADVYEFTDIETNQMKTSNY